MSLETDVLEDWISPLMDDFYDYIRIKIDSVDSMEIPLGAVKPQQDIISSWITHVYSYIRQSIRLLREAPTSHIHSELYSKESLPAPTISRELTRSRFVPTLIQKYLEENTKYVMRTQIVLSERKYIIDKIFFGEISSAEMIQYNENLQWILILLGVITLIDIQKSTTSTTLSDKSNKSIRKEKGYKHKSTKHMETKNELRGGITKMIHIQLGLTPFMKVMPTSTMETISEINANSGVSMVETEYEAEIGKKPIELSEILIFRNEEWFKVLIHELLHVFHMEMNCAGVNQTEMRTNMAKTFPIKSDFAISESLAEFWAVLLNSVFIAYRKTIIQMELGNLSITTGITKKNTLSNQIGRKMETEGHPLLHFERTIATARFILMTEQLFAMFQMVKILRFMNMTYIDLYSKSESSVILRDYFYKEKTNVFAYYILKNLMMFHMEEYLQWARKNSKTGTLLIVLKSSDATLKRLFAWIIAKHDSHDFIAQTGLILELINKLKSASMSSDKALKEHLKRVLTTMRMTVAKWE